MKELLEGAKPAAVARAAVSGLRQLRPEEVTVTTPPPHPSLSRPPSVDSCVSLPSFPCPVRVCKKSYGYESERKSEKNSSKREQQPDSFPDLSHDLV